MKLTSALPEGISRSEISYRMQGGLRGSREVRRPAAEFARLRTAAHTGYESGWSAPGQLTLGNAERYIEQAWQRMRSQDNVIRRIRESVDLSCPWCERERTHLGTLGFMTGQRASSPIARPNGARS